MKNMCFLLSALLLAVAVKGQNPCNLVITGDFDSECLYSNKTSYTNEYPTLMVACEHSHVTYTASVDPALTVVSYTWEVAGDVSHTATGNQLTVNWGADGWGLLVVTVTTIEGTTCTATAGVKLIAAPVAGASTVPAYTINADGDKVIRVCKGSRVEFIDQSTDDGSDIAGYHWQCTYAAPASTPNYVIDDVQADDKVVHRVYNNCGCYDEENYLIEVLEGATLQLDCYGTVCEGAVVEYSVTAPSCTDYVWHVEGGTLVGGQGTAHPAVQWDRPQDGYGVLSLDGVLCGEEVCPSMMSVRVPIIQNHLPIEGPERVCLGESALYRLPLFGSTRYDWSIQPAVPMVGDMAYGNEMRFNFPSAGTYRINVTYQCEFLDCGPYHSETLVVNVHPNLTIEGQERICVSNSCELHTEPLVSATWHAYDLGNGNAPVGSLTTGSIYCESFPQGRYLITAESPTHCGPATFVLTVKDVPPAPSADDLSPYNRHTACPYGGICLTGTPAEPHYNLVWAPACSTAAPQIYSGDSVNISYSDEVCNVLVYHYDRLLQCRSTNAYVHTVTPLVPAATTLPTNITVCPNSIVSLHDMVTDQYNDGIRYEWKIEELKQYCASVRGSHQLPDVTLLVNDLGTTTSYSFYVELTRTFCDNYSVTDRVNITVRNDLTASPSINGPSNLCLGAQATFTGSGCTPDHYSWIINNTPYSGDHASHTFHRAGISLVHLFCNPYDQCTNTAYRVSTQMPVTVHTPQHLQNIVCSNTMPHVLSLQPDQCSCTGYTFAWYYSPASGSPDPPLLVGTGCTYQPSAPGIYECVVTDGNGCSSSVSCTYPYPDLPWSAMTFTEDSRDYCNGIIQITALPSTYNILWTADGAGSLVAGGTHNCTAVITFDDLGTCYANAEMVFGSAYYRGTTAVTLDFKPSFQLTSNCGDIKIDNHSRYLNSAQTIYLDIVNDNTNTHHPVSFPASQGVYHFSPSPAITATTHFTAYLVGYGTNGNVTNCPVAEITLDPSSPTLNPVNLATNNPYSPYSPSYTCDNTPLHLTASPTYPATIVSSTWHFGDGSSYSTDGSSIYHTFSTGNHTITVEITDSRGCERHNTTPLTINSYNNYLNGGQLQASMLLNCPHVLPPQEEIHYSSHSFIPPFNHYTWNPPLTGTNYNNYVSEPDIYGVSVVNDHFCKKEAATYVKFKPCPTARIYAENFSCCTGQPLPLYGSLDPTLGLQYSWHVTNTSGFSQTFNTGDIVFTPTVSGTYDVTLTVTDLLTTCASTAHATVTANPRPAPPTLAFVGSPCLENAPVALTASGYSGELHWSNGTTGTNSLYYTPGFATAYYYDPTIGCPSRNDSIYIHHQPDFDALLTGCYEKCPEYLATHTLPVYSLTPDTVDWQWYFENSVLASYLHDEMPLNLPFSYRTGVYQLNVDYQNGGCHSLSPKLSITTKKVCDCENIGVDLKVTDTIVQNCKVRYTLNVTVCNNNTASFCIDNVTVISPAANISVIYDGLTGNTITANDCDDYTLILECMELVPTNVLLQITDENCLDCTKQFCIDLTPDIECQQDISDADVDINFSNDAAAYYNFSMCIPSRCKLLAFWGEPSMVLDYNYTPGYIDGLWMLDLGVLQQIEAADSEVCLHALLCCNDTLCLYTYCIDAEKLVNLIEQAYRNDSSDTKITSRTLFEYPSDNDGLFFAGNPTTGEVGIMGNTDEITEVLVIDMHGRRMAHYESVSMFSVAPLPASTYIVRITTQADNTSPQKHHYLRLIKK